MMTATQRRGQVGRRSFSLAWLAATTTFLVLSGCADVDIHGPDWTWDDGFLEARNTDYAAQASFRFPAPAAETLSLEGVAGSIEIVGSSDADGIVVEGVRRVRSHSTADARRHLDDLLVDVSDSGGTVFVETRQPASTRGRAYEVEYRIEVPVGTSVNVTHVAGPVEIRSVSGDAGVDAVAGMVRLIDLTGNVWASVVAGGVDASVSVPPDGLVELRSNAGDIHLTLPTETSASLRAVAMSGAVHVVDLTLVDQDPRASVLRATMAGGDGTIRLESVAGDITVQGR
jgi:hypothetical protein